MEHSHEELGLVQPENYSTQLQTFEAGLVTFIDSCGLPADGVLVSLPERLDVFRNVEAVLRTLPPEYRERAMYVSKFLAACAAGLFDAALNYLWNETVLELRRRVASYDLSYFLDVAVQNPERRKKLNTIEDLVKVEDSELIEGSREIGLISDVAFKHLDLIRYMRNWASAAHPNQNEIAGLQLASWLQTCLRDVITLPFPQVTVKIGRLLRNIKTNEIGSAEASQIAVFFDDLVQDRVDSLASGFFGIYCQKDTVPQTRDNIRVLAPHLWPRVSEPTRKQFGVRYGQYVANNDMDEQQLAREFLETVEASQYIPDALRAAEIETAIQNLLNAHREFNNFYNEPPFARQLRALVGAGAIPPQIEERYVLTLVEVYLTNGNGVAVNAEPIYGELLSGLSSRLALLAILAFTDEKIASRLQFRLCQRKYCQLVELLEHKVASPAAHETIEAIKAFTGPLEHLRDDAGIKRSVRNLAIILQG